MTTPDENAEAFAKMLMDIHDRADSQTRESMDNIIRESVTNALEQGKAAIGAMHAIKLLHCGGKGERHGFCSECGNVVPCQTRKFIAPFVGE